MNLQQILDEFARAFEPVFGTIDPAIAARLLLAFILCGLIGLERSGKKRAIGFRQHILVGVGACLMSLAGGYGFPEIEGSRDVLRPAAYVISGIGFLGAGAILRHGISIIGMTTAASIWCAAGIGIACGVGLGALAVITTVLVLFTLQPLEIIEELYQNRSATPSFDVHLQDDDRAVGKTLGALARLGVPIKQATVLPGENGSGVLHIELSQPMKKPDVRRMVADLLTLKVVEQVDTEALRGSSNGGDSAPENQPQKDKAAPAEDQEAEV
jgi:putative Mg2+ transporter-C (MgtC) family protein